MPVDEYANWLLRNACTANETKVGMYVCEADFSTSHLLHYRHILPHTHKRPFQVLGVCVGWLEDQPSRMTGRMEIRPAAEQGPIIVCLDTSGMYMQHFISIDNGNLIHYLPHTRKVITNFKFISFNIIQCSFDPKK